MASSEKVITDTDGTGGGDDSGDREVGGSSSVEGGQ